MPRPLRSRGVLDYDKPSLTIGELVTRLVSRGLDVQDPDRASRYLRHIGYYRLSPYTIPFQQGGPDHHFLAGTTFRSPDLPPSWLMVEALSIGQLASVYGNVRFPTDRTAVARSIGLTAALLGSWMQTYVRVRNICAHHGRRWNVGLGVYPKTPTSRGVSWLMGEHALPEGSTRRLYPVLVSLQTVLDSVSPRSGWAQRLHQLLSTRPPMNLCGMGIPDDWAADQFWTRHLA